MLLRSIPAGVSLPWLPVFRAWMKNIYDTIKGRPWRLTQPPPSKRCKIQEKLKCLTSHTKVIKSSHAKICIVVQSYLFYMET